MNKEPETDRRINMPALLASASIPNPEHEIATLRNENASQMAALFRLRDDNRSLRCRLENAEQDAAQSDVDTLRALHERNELRVAYEDSQNTIRELRCRLDDYDTRLTEVMPLDFKDWHQNSKLEWPLIAAGTIKRQAEHIEHYCDDISKSRAENETLVKRLADIAAANVAQEFRIIDLEKEITGLRRENDHKFAAMCRLREEIADAKNAWSNSQTRVMELEFENRALRKERGDLRADNDELIMHSIDY